MSEDSFRATAVAHLNALPNMSDASSAIEMKSLRFKKTYQPKDISDSDTEESFKEFIDESNAQPPTHHDAELATLKFTISDPQHVREPTASIEGNDSETNKKEEPKPLAKLTPPQSVIEAIRAQDAKTFSEFLENEKANLNQYFYLGKPLLVYALDEAKNGAVDLLLQAGVDTSLKDSHNNNALHIVCKKRTNQVSR
ncbi:hypothetical protein JQC92_17550 [Shewanella sp. 202IG2-18]|uniref:hypothetical protein n=1 Tax=Parashewanella hymeniacidonis TaxID=2807618 RepID=UPI001961B868|nr:hypothetical protein [Parashewanella hymeniacidonis]MBM7073817.1 hypothetical protein [Parashewanella hymeniacidonis]